MAVNIKEVKRFSSSWFAGIKVGDRLHKLNGHEINDILDYDFYRTEKKLSIELDRNGKRLTRTIYKNEYQDIGLGFESYLMDKQRSCANRCVFCFIDQLPGGMRESLYFKDDDVRLSFLHGNYVTMTNFSSRDIKRIAEMHISPINISVHTTNPALRVKMLSNKNAGKLMEIMTYFAKHNISMNAQIVVCPGYNDGEELEKTLHDLVALGEPLVSISCVPVGLTCHRKGLVKLTPVTPEKAREIISVVNRWDKIAEKTKCGGVYAADELYIKAGEKLPTPESYREYPQLENGVGMLSLLREEFTEALGEYKPRDIERNISVATGKAAAPYIRELALLLEKREPGIKCNIYEIENRFFGEGVTVAGLLTGQDIAEALSDKELGDMMLISRDMLRAGSEVLLDDMTIGELSKKLGVSILPVDSEGGKLLSAMTGESDNLAIK